MDNLTVLRNKINKLDEGIIKLIGRRLKVVKDVGNYKKQQSIPPLDAKRWGEVMMARIELGKHYGLSEKVIREVFEALHVEALAVEEKIQHDK